MPLNRTRRRRKKSNLPNTLRWNNSRPGVLSRFALPLGYAKEFLNIKNRVYAYLNEASFPFYIFHFLPITVVAYFIARANANVWLKYILLVVAAYPGTLGLYEIVRQIPYIRVAFWIKAKARVGSAL
jgi:peptidoglycan/LPS O-acetylase OafA/YrhL